MSKSLGLALAAGLTTGLVFLSVVFGGTLGVLLIYLVPLPLMLAGLSLGLKPMLGGTAAAVAAVGLVSPSAMPSFALVAVLPALVVVRQSLLWRRNGEGGIDWYPPGALMAWLTGIAIALLLLVAAVLASQGPGIEELVHQHVTEFVGQVAAGAPDEARDRLIAIWSALMPAMAACAWLAIVVLNGVLAQWILTRSGRAIRPTPAYATFELPYWMALALAVSALVGLVAGGDVGYLARNIAVALGWPYVFAGLATVHQVVRGRPNAGSLLALFYVAFFVLFGWAIVAVAGLGLVRHWTRPQRRDADGGQEEK